MNAPLDIDALRRKLEGSSGESYWRSLDELAGAPDFLSHLHREFQEGASQWEDPAGRRQFLKLMGASLAMAGLQGCISSPPQEKIVPYVEAPENVVPGRPDFYATTFPFRGYGQGVLVESHTGRPTKLEGNPDHPASLGGTSAFSQASVLGLYDPARSATPYLRGQPATIDRFTSALQDQMRRFRADGGAGLHVLSENSTSPTMAAQQASLLEQFPDARWHVHEPVDSLGRLDGLHRVFGRPTTPVYHIDRAGAILSIDSDFLFALPGSIRYARDFSDGRRIRAGEADMNRLYSIESTLSITGAMADHRLPLAPSEVRQFVNALSGHFGVAGMRGTVSQHEREWLVRMADDLVESGGLIVAGESLPPELHVLVHRINERLGHVGQTVEYVASADLQPSTGRRGLSGLVDAVEAGAVETLIILGGNPAYTAPAGSGFAQVLPNVPVSMHLSIHRDETSRRCTWHVPQTHYLEEWGDLRAYDGSASIIQPLIAPLFDACRSVHDVLSTMLGSPGSGGYEAVRSFWRDRLPDPFEESWSDALRLGVIRDSGTLDLSTPSAARGQAEDDLPGIERGSADPPADEDGLSGYEPRSYEPRGDEFGGDEPEDQALEIIFRPDPTVWDGTYATNAWLQELPKPITKLVWDNAVLIAPELAARRGIEREQIVEISVDGRSIQAPAWITPGLPPNAVTVFLGYGRRHASQEVSGKGYDAYQLRTAANAWSASGIQLRPQEDRYALASTQHHHSMEGRDLVRAAEIGRFRQNVDFVHDGEPDEHASLYPEFEYPINKWGMVIDLNVCIGCNACIAACQSENNIPVVGKDEVRRGREMHWLRVDRYYKGPLDNPEVYFQPVPCMHCEKAPCEVVCPVYATVHDAEGLNVMVYNRCIGTRYCSNNCPYKVRRFNFLDYTKWQHDLPSLQKNPDVTVRSRGVMEKCTYCIQRISAARIRAKKEERPIHDGEVLTACQMACPTQAIVFGDLARNGSAVRRLHDEPHNYKLLSELGTQPRTSYLAHFRNANERMPAIADGAVRLGQEEEIEVDVGGAAE